MLIILAGLSFVGTGSLWMGSGDATVPTRAWWIGFLVLLPLGLAILVWLELRWTAIACVIYATVGLALDLATVVQILTRDTDVFASLMISLVSGLLNFLLIVFGGRSSLDLPLAPPPRESRPSSPPHAS